MGERVLFASNELIFWAGKCAGEVVMPLGGVFAGGVLIPLGGVFAGEVVMPLGGVFAGEACLAPTRLTASAAPHP